MDFIDIGFETAFASPLSYIFIVDDDEDDRELLTDALAESSFPKDKIKIAVDGEDLLLKLNREECLPSLIFLDLNMPKRSGRDVLAALQSHEQFKQIPVLIFSTSDSSIDVSECYSLGCNAYIFKPSDYQSLLSLVRKLISFWSDKFLQQPNASKNSMIV